MGELDAVILASGLSLRMGCNKLLLPLGSSTIIEKFLTNFPYSLFGKVILVYSDNMVGEVSDQFPVETCYNCSPESGKSHSIHLGLGASDAKKGIMFLVADQPLLSKRTVEKLVRSFAADPRRIVVPVIDGSPRNPVIFPVDCRAELLAQKRDCGGREVIKNNLERVQAVECFSPDEFYDIDTVEMYEKVLTLWR